MGILISIVLSAVSFLYLAPTLFYIGIRDFYNIAPSVTAQCETVVVDAAIAFARVYDLISISTSLVLLILAVYLCWRYYSLKKISV